MGSKQPLHGPEASSKADPSSQSVRRTRSTMSIDRQASRGSAAPMIAPEDRSAQWHSIGMPAARIVSAHRDVHRQTGDAELEVAARISEVDRLLRAYVYLRNALRQSSLKPSKVSSRNKSSDALVSDTWLAGNRGRNRI